MIYTHLFFDLDNTLFDFNQSSRRAFSSLLSLFEIAEQDGMYALYHEINMEMWTKLEAGEIDQLTLRKQRFNLFFEAIGVRHDGLEANVRYLNYLVEHSELIPGANALLDQVNQTHNLIAITNGLKEVQRPRLKITDTNKYFDYVIVSDEIGFAKPHKTFFDVAYDPIKAQVPKEQILVIGDSVNSDIRGGRDFGFDTCHFAPKTYNYTDVVPNYTAESFEELLQILNPK